MGVAAVTRRQGGAAGLYVPLALTIAMSTAVFALAWYGYRAMREWRRSSMVLVERTVQDGADLLVTALTRDMRGAQALVLANRDAGDYATQPLPDFSAEVAAAFTRYPYPESFFGWRRSDGDVVFFNRAARNPPWAHSPVAAARYPVVVARNPDIASALLAQIQRHAANRRAYAHFETMLAGVPYEIVARLQYADAYRDRVEHVTGFTVNLAWVRERYFPEIVSEVARIGESGTALEYAVFDDAGRAVGGGLNGDPAAVRAFPLQFFDPSTIELHAEDVAPPMWQVRVSAPSDPTLTWATYGEDWILLVMVVTALGLALSFFLAAFSLRASASLTAMRAEFVSIVTHELKTPLATIRAASDTMVRGRLTGDGIHQYSLLLVQESRRLSRLVDNLLAYARITDVTELYTFERLEPAELIEESISGFERQLAEGHFDVATDVPHDLPLVRGDRTALRLALDNLIDNAIRYSGGTRWIRVNARRSGSRVLIEVCDRGAGIAPDEIQSVKRRFVRGRRARTQGSGLGLAIVMRVAEDHGGALELESQVGKGTSARFDLPVYEDWS
jgi:two-component system, OmpR family, phosphate regulon sensor histidine kinase PhoR